MLDSLMTYALGNISTLRDKVNEYDSKFKNNKGFNTIPPNLLQHSKSMDGKEEQNKRNRTSSHQQ